jgi:hypothetical protein
MGTYVHLFGRDYLYVHMCAAHDVINNGGKRHIHQHCKTRYKSKDAKLIERYYE